MTTAEMKAVTEMLRALLEQAGPLVKRIEDELL